jgi:LacI family transcriptional regulator
MAALLARVQPDAVFAGNDMVAFGAMTALREAGLGIPEDVAVVGFDDIPLAAHACPALTTVRLPAVGIGHRAAERLIRRIEGRELEAEVGDESDGGLLATELVVRASCGATSRRITVEDAPPG